MLNNAEDVASNDLELGRWGWLLGNAYLGPVVPEPAKPPSQCP